MPTTCQRKKSKRHQAIPLLFFLHTDRLSALWFIKIPVGVAIEMESKGFTSRLNEKNPAQQEKSHCTFLWFPGSTPTKGSL